MRKILYCFILPLMAFFATLLVSCERTLEFQGQFNSGIAISCLAQPGEPFYLTVSKSFNINTNPTRVFSTDGEVYYREIDTLYDEEIVIKNAKAEITVNGTDHYSLVYTGISSVLHQPIPFSYTCDYVPKVGDEIEVRVSAPGYDDVHATTKVLDPQTIEVVNKEVVYKENEYDGTGIYDDPYERFGLDSVMNITMRIHDPKGERNYYRLKVRGVADRYSYTGTWRHDYWTMTDVFYTDDVLLRDNMLAKPFGDWKAGVTNVFDDHLIDGRDYTFTVESRMMKGDNPRVIVELQTIPAEMYYFFKSYLQIRIATSDSYTSPVGLYSNVENGWGIFGSLSYDRHTVYY